MQRRVGELFKDRDEGLWSKIFYAKYLNSDSLLSESYKKPANVSSTWSSILYGTELLKNGIFRRIGNGATAKFWYDNWFSCSPLKDHVLEGSMIDDNACVMDF